MKKWSATFFFVSYTENHYCGTHKFEFWLLDNEVIDLELDFFSTFTPPYMRIFWCIVKIPLNLGVGKIWRLAVTL